MPKKLQKANPEDSIIIPNAHSEEELIQALEIAVALAEESGEPELNYPKQGETYSHKDHLTLDLNGQPRTQSLNDWICNNPVELHKALLEKDFLLARDSYRILMRNLRANDIDYYRKAVRLDILIDFPGHVQQVPAKSMYDFEPVKFYKWWSANEKKVCMSSREKIQLFLKVESIRPGTLQKQHQEYMKNLRPTGK